jgi:uncharacterized protein YqjF (DUF2071 family)
MTVTRVGNDVAYASDRDDNPSATLRIVYGPKDSAFTAAAGSLEHFLTERYCLYNVDRRGRPYRLEIHHPPWSLQTASATLTCNTMAAVNGVELPQIPPLVHFARRQDAVAWAPNRL